MLNSFFFRNHGGRWVNKRSIMVRFPKKEKKLDRLWVDSGRSDHGKRISQSYGALWVLMGSKNGQLVEKDCNGSSRLWNYFWELLLSVPFSKCWSSTVREKYGQLHVHICHCTFVSRPNGNENRTKMGGCTLMWIFVNDMMVFGTGSQGLPEVSCCWHSEDRKLKYMEQMIKLKLV